MKLVLSILALCAFTPMLLAETKRQLDSHVHGTGQLNIAVDNDVVLMTLHAPGADIVGFEYAARTSQDRASVEAALAVLEQPFDLFVLPAEARCQITKAHADLEVEAAHADETKHTDHAHDHDHDDGHDDGHGDEHDHSEEDAAGHHSEFHAEYRLRCAAPSKINQVMFPYFDRFPNAKKLTVQIVSPTGAQAAEVTSNAPDLQLGGLF